MIHIPFDHHIRHNQIHLQSYLEGEEGLESDRLDGGGGIGGDLGEGGDFHDDEEKIDFFVVIVPSWIFCRQFQHSNQIGKLNLCTPF